MHANVTTDKGGGGGGSWRLPADETLQVGGTEKSKEDELAYGPEGHNWRSIIFSLLVINFVIAGIVTAIYLLGYVDELLYWSGRRMRFDEFLQGDVAPHRLPSSWVTNTKFVFQNDEGGLAIFDTANDSVTLLVTNHTMRQLNVKGYQCSTDLRYVLFKHNIKHVFRYTSTALYTVYDVTNDHHMPVRLKDSPKVQRTRLQSARWLGNTTALILVVDNDIFVRQSPSDEEDIRLTTTGHPDLIYNGIPDWLYQEEIFQSDEAVWGSPDGTHIMYASFNDTNVGEMEYPWFSSTTILRASGLDNGGTFPASKTVRYPTPGTLNPEVMLWVVDLANATDPQRWRVKPPLAFDEQDYYLVSARWVGTTNHEISVVWMTRSQTYSVVTLCLAPNWTCIENHSERAPEKEWLDMVQHPVFSPDGDSFLLLAGIQESDTEHFTHIKHVTITQQRIAVLSHGRYETAEQIIVLTHGKYEVLKILAWDTFNHEVYYLGTQDKKPGQQHLYKVRNPITSDPREEPQCITCDLGDKLWSSRYYYNNCTYFNAYVGPEKSSIATETPVSYYILECLGPGLPLAGVHSAQTHRLVRILYDTRPAFTPKLEELALPSQRSFEIALPHGTRAQVQLFLPPSWREELRDASFPVLVEVNGKPGTTSISEKFSIDWGKYMSSKNDIVYVRIDVRGSKGQGKQSLYHHLGGVEVLDQIVAIKYLLATYSYLDETRVGAWGWGYGGYVVAMLLGSQQKEIKCGIAVSPITDWLFYNSVFTERLLGLPAENFKAYVEADATQRARNIPSESFLLLHGLADLTAPYLHGIQLARSLHEANVLFSYQTYPDEGHHLYGVLGHAYRTMESNLRDCLSLDDDADHPRDPFE